MWGKNDILHVKAQCFIETAGFISAQQCVSQDISISRFQQIRPNLQPKHQSKRR